VSLPRICDLSQSQIRGDVTDPRYFVWTNFNAALKAQNKALALSYLTPTAQENYASAIEAIMPQLASTTATPPSNLLRINASDTTADRSGSAFPGSELSVKLG
jgi:hypothetical protein